MKDSDFHSERRTGLGGSDLGAILGLNLYKTPLDVFNEKTGRAEPFTGNIQTRFGKYAEEFASIPSGPAARCNDSTPCCGTLTRR